MYITGERGDSSLLISSIRTWSSPELMMKHLWNEYSLKFLRVEHRVDFAEAYGFEAFLSSTYSSLRVYFSPTNQDEAPKLLKVPELLALATVLKYIQ